jgi:hypothetical protein
MFSVDRQLFDPSEIDLPIFLKLSFDELNQYIAGNKHYHHSRNTRVLKALSTSSKYEQILAKISTKYFI